jgi:putative transposase
MKLNSMNLGSRMFYKNTYYHIYNRGVEKRKIFIDDKDYTFFLKRMKQYKTKQKISLLCYSLMPNHFHMFVKQNLEDKTIGKFIADLINSYTKAFNKRYGRSGVLLQGPTKSIEVDNPGYFIWLCKYILRNPVKAKLVEHPVNWVYSSAGEYYGIKSADLTDIEDMLTCFKTLDELKKFIDEKDDDFDYDVFK